MYERCQLLRARGIHVNSSRETPPAEFLTWLLFYKVAIPARPIIQNEKERSPSRILQPRERIHWKQVIQLENDRDWVISVRMTPSYWTKYKPSSAPSSRRHWRRTDGWQLERGARLRYRASAKKHWTGEAIQRFFKSISRTSNTNCTSSKSPRTLDGNSHWIQNFVHFSVHQRLFLGSSKKGFDSAISVYETMAVLWTVSKEKTESHLRHALWRRSNVIFITSQFVQDIWRRLRLTSELV